MDSACLDFVPSELAVEQRLLPLRVSGLNLCLGGRQVLNDLDFELAGEGVTTVLGPNGAGKTLLLRVLHGLLQPDAGEVSWNGMNPRAARPCQGMVFQRPVMLRRSVAANIRFVMRTRGVARRLRAGRLATVLELTGLQDLAQAPARRLSGGEQQRMAIARAWVARPAVLFLDEPTANLDPRGVRTIEALIARVRAAGTRVILTTHDLGQARRLADDVLFLAGGRLLEHSTGASFFAEHGPATAQAAAFLRGDLID
ncbi:MAG TPA: ATP-binding cassette domain-containing protein [Rhodanobacter sp.]|jgi:tungstate transport system ATP-binding protein